MAFPVPLLVARNNLSRAMLDVVRDVEATNILIDSGAFAYSQRGEVGDLDDYCRWLEDLPFQPTTYFTMDVIGDPIATFNNYLEMKRRGFGPMPIWTTGATREQLAVCKADGRVGIGGLRNGAYSSMQTNTKRIEEAASLAPDVHLLGVAGEGLLRKYRPAATDASSPFMAPVFKRLPVYTGSHRLAYWASMNNANDIPRELYLSLMRLGLNPRLLRTASWSNVTAMKSGVKTPAVMACVSWLRYLYDWLGSGTTIYTSATTTHQVLALHFGYLHGVEQGWWTDASWQV